MNRKTLADYPPAIQAQIEASLHPAKLVEPIKSNPGAPMKATESQLVESYNRTGSVWKTADEFGMCGQSVHERLAKLNIIRSPQLTDAERALIRDAYSAGFLRGDNVLAQLSAMTGRTKQLICREARAMGLTCKNRGVNAAIAAEQGVRVSANFAANGHPRGMSGKTHSQETKDKISEKTTGRVVPPEQSLRMLKTRVARYGTASPPHAGRGSWKAGWREIGGQRIYARSRWEANYARYLQWLLEHAKIAKWEHEPETFWFENILRGVRSYLPDFRVTLPDGSLEYHEVKGWMDPKSATKLKRMEKYHPHIVIILIEKKRMKFLAREFGTLIDGWECKGYPLT